MRLDVLRLIEIECICIGLHSFIRLGWFYSQKQGDTIHDVFEPRSAMFMTQLSLILDKQTVV